MVIRKCNVLLVVLRRAKSETGRIILSHKQWLHRYDGELDGRGYF